MAFGKRWGMPSYIGCIHSNNQTDSYIWSDNFVDCDGDPEPSATLKVLSNDLNKHYTPLIDVGSNPFKDDDRLG